MTWFISAGRDPVIGAFFWSTLTITSYLCVKAMYRRWSRWWLAPLAITPLALILTAIVLHASYRDYIRGTHWLVALLGPATVAFAVPIYEQRSLIRQHWRVLGLGMLTGTATSMLSSWCLAMVLGLDGNLRLSLLPRSISTPFAMTISGEIGGTPDLTAVFVVATGIIGAIVGELLLTWFPGWSPLARGALLGVGAHGAGTAKAHEFGRQEGSVAGLVMVLVGLFNVLLAPVVAACLRVG
ncbi:putative murein hydrolase (TIGR00659 family) [Bradyrhizobium niftali]|uniref:LrgB family protein n=1 Tax=Bradyrhizobium niftali TaxID=2560055 RepID=UPI0038348CBD